MAITTTSSLRVELNWTQTDTGLGDNQARDSVTMSRTTQLTDGTGLSQANKVFYGTGLLAPGGSDTIDFQNLSRNLFGNNISLSLDGGWLKFLSVENTSTGANQFIELDNTIAQGQTGYAQSTVIPIYPSGIMAFSNPLSGWVINSSNRYVRINDGGAGSTFEIGIVSANP